MARSTAPRVAKPVARAEPDTESASERAVMLSRSQWKLTFEALESAQKALAKAGFTGRTHERLDKILEAVDAACEGAEND